MFLVPLNHPTCTLEDFPGGADGDLAGVDELVGEVPDGQPHQAPARVGEGGGDAILEMESGSWQCVFWCCDALMLVHWLYIANIIWGPCIYES